MHTPIFMGSLLEVGAVLRRGQSNADQATRPAGGWFSLLQYEHAGGRCLSGDTLRATHRACRDEVQRALAPLKADPRVARVRTPYDVSPPDPAMLSRDGHRARVLVELAVRASGLVTLGFSSVSPEVYASLRAKVQSRTLEVVGAGMLAINHDFVEVAKRDLKRAELVILPVVV